MSFVKAGKILFRSSQLKVIADKINGRKKKVSNVENKYRETYIIDCYDLLSTDKLVEENTS